MQHAIQKEGFILFQILNQSNPTSPSLFRIVGCIFSIQSNPRIKKNMSLFAYQSTCFCTIGPVSIHTRLLSSKRAECKFDLKKKNYLFLMCMPLSTLCSIKYLSSKVYIVVILKSDLLTCCTLSLLDALNRYWSSC